MCAEKSSFSQNTIISRLVCLFLNFHVISHISIVARKWIIIIRTKYLMFPLFRQAHKQMRHQQFIAHTITWRLFPTVRPELAAGLTSASELLGRSQLEVQTTAALMHKQTTNAESVLYTTVHMCMHTAVHVWSLKTHVLRVLMLVLHLILPFLIAQTFSVCHVLNRLVSPLNMNILCMTIMAFPGSDSSCQ